MSFQQLYNIASGERNRSHPGEPAQLFEGFAVGHAESTIRGQQRATGSQRPMTNGCRPRANLQQSIVADWVSAAHGRRSTTHDQWATAGNQRPGTSGRQSAGSDERPTTRGYLHRPTGDGQRPASDADGRRQGHRLHSSGIPNEGSLLVGRSPTLPVIEPGRAGVKKLIWT